MMDRDERSEGGVNGSPWKILLDENKAYVSISIRSFILPSRWHKPTRDELTLETVTKNSTQSGSKWIAIYSSKTQRKVEATIYQTLKKLFQIDFQKRFFQWAYKDSTINSKAQNRLKQSLSRRSIKRLIKNTRASQVQDQLNYLIKHAKANKYELTAIDLTVHISKSASNKFSSTLI